MTPIEKLAELVGFHTCYTNSFGEQVYATDESRFALLKAMGYQVDDPQSIESCITQLQHKSWQKLLPSTMVIKAEDKIYCVDITIDESLSSHQLNWDISLENGKKLKGKVVLSSLNLVEKNSINDKTYYRYQLTLPDMPLGYHTLKANLQNQPEASCHLIVAPARCYAPTDAADYKMWGLAAQLYSLKSATSWGLGDFSDLTELVNKAASHGASTIGLNPLHPLFPDNPAHRSPYSPTSRNFLNTMYIDVTKVINFNQCQQAVDLVNSEDFQRQITELNQQEHIDYPHTAHLKYQVLEILYTHFEKEHCQKNTIQARQFAHFREEFSPELNTLATFDALYEHFRKKDPHAYGWTNWPKAFQTPDSEAVIQFQKDNQSRIQYFKFIQWVADTQLAEAATQAKNAGMAVGLYLDLAVGCDGSGADVWANRSVYVSGGAVGAPPDATNLLGQDWGLTPINPITLKEQGFELLVKALRSNMRHAGALRIDHVLGYMRQYWVAPGKKADQGIYISFPFEEMLRIIALESQRSQCIVIGEDLGTTPDGFGEIMAKAGLLSYRVLFFERWESGLFQRPENYPEQSMVTVSTHDLPTLAGWWTGTDLVWREKLELYPCETMGQNDRNNRITDREQLIAAMIDMQVLPPGKSPATSPAVMNTALSQAVQRFLAKAPSRIQLIPLEDALGMHQQVNIPGTIDQHPNWLQRLPVDLSDIWQQEDMKNLLNVMQQERPTPAKQLNCYGS